MTGIRLEALPTLLLGRRWSNRIPWRVHGFLDRRATTGLYRRAPVERMVVDERPSRATLLFSGDLALHRWPEGQAPERVFGTVKAEFEQADLRVVNLESVLTAVQEPSGIIGVFLRSSPENIEVLEYLDVNVAGVANNHALDFGTSALAEERRHLQDHGIDVLGLADGSRPDEVEGSVVRVVNGLRVGIVSATDHFGGIPAKSGVMPVWVDPGGLEDAVRRLRSACDIVAVVLHWGYEYVMYPLLWHRDVARRLVEVGADVVCCHHAHVVMGAELWGNGVIAHGLGNFFMGGSSQSHPLRPFGLLLKVEVDQAGLVGAEVVPVRADPSGTVHRERMAPPGYQRICRGLGNDVFLKRVENTRIAHELGVIASGVKRFLVEGDEARLMERKAFLQAPREQWLLRAGESAGSRDQQTIAAWLRRFSQLSSESVRRLKIPEVPSVSGLEAAQDSRRLAGRLP